MTRYKLWIAAAVVLSVTYTSGRIDAQTKKVPSAQVNVQGLP